MAPSYGWGSTVSRLQSRYKETVYCLPLSLQECLVLISSFSKGGKAKPTLEPLWDFEPGTPALGIQHPNHYVIASTPDPKILGLNSIDMLGQALGINFIPRLSENFGSYKIKCSE